MLHANKTGVVAYAIALVLVFLPGGCARPSAGSPSVSAPVAPPGLPNELAHRFGISFGDRWLHADESTIRDYVERTVGVGATMIRIDVRQSIVERAGPDPATRDWHTLDLMVEQARRHNLTVLATVCTSAPWNRPAGQGEVWGPSTDAEREGFARFAAAAVERYRDSVSDWEVWNEQNLVQFWSRPDAEAYAALLKVTAPRIREANPRARVIVGGTGGTGGGPNIVSGDWFERFYQVPDIGNYFDAAAVHPYIYVTNGQPEIDSGEMAQARRVQELIDRVDPGKPLWATEFGVPTGGDASVDEQTQASTVYDMITRWRQISDGPMFFYTLYDNSEPSREGYFGIFRADGSAKPVLGTLQRRLTG